MARKRELDFIDGKKVRERLKYLGLTQKYVANQLGMSERNFSRSLSNNEMNIINTYRISKITNLSIDELTDSGFELFGPPDNLRTFLETLGATMKEDAPYRRTRMNEIHEELRTTKKVKYNGKMIPYTEVLFRLILEFCDITDYEIDTFPKDSILPNLELIKFFVEQRIVKPHQQLLSLQQLENIRRLEGHDNELHVEWIPSDKSNNSD